MDWDQRWKMRDTPWDKGVPSPVFQNFLKKEYIKGTILIPGCGVGHDAALFAAGDHVQVLGVDISKTAISEARNLYDKSNLKWRVGDFLSEDFLLGSSFDWIIEHTCLCAIDPRDRPLYVKSVKRLLKKRGSFLGIFFKKPDTESGPPFKISDLEIEELFSDFELERKWVPTVGFEGRFGREEVRLYKNS